MLLAKGTGRAEILVYHSDFRKLGEAVKGCDICLIDTFPAVNPIGYAAMCRDFAKKVVII